VTSEFIGPVIRIDGVVCALSLRSLTSLNIASNGLGGPTWNRDLTGVQALAAVIPQMTSLTSLDISSNELDDGTKAQIKLAAASGGVGVVL